MPFGLHDTPVTFQRMMDKFLWDVPSFAAAYLDDVVIRSTTWEEHLEHVCSVLQKLPSAELTVIPRKYQFGVTQYVYLGHNIGSGMVSPEESKV